MKYMGSKRVMLQNGLGELIKDQAQDANRIVDPFCGSGAVAWYAAEQTSKMVIASDLQMYAVVLARSVLSRTRPLLVEKSLSSWFMRANNLLQSTSVYKLAAQYERWDGITSVEKYVSQARALCSDVEGGAIWNSYGGHYFSPLQALKIDLLRETLAEQEPNYSTMLAALISSASMCVASPGHTAQPFQPTQGASPYLLEAWQRDPFEYCEKVLLDLSGRYAQVAGKAYVQDATKLAATVQENDLIILDPPYSSVHYSRFYHVLETIAHGKCGPVDGTGRYPPRKERPRSLFSLKSHSTKALSQLLEILAAKNARVILTFPAGQSSNGLTGEQVIQIARDSFEVSKTIVTSRFSTLGGNIRLRPARQNSDELILLLSAK